MSTLSGQRAASFGVVERRLLVVAFCLFVLVLLEPCASSKALDVQRHWKGLGAHGWGPIQPGLPKPLGKILRRVVAPAKTSQDHEPEEAEASVVDPSAGIPEKRLLRVRSEILLPCAPEKAFDLYSNLTNQPSWSTWLSSVEYLDDQQAKSSDAISLSKWTIKIFGISYSWTAEVLRSDRPTKLQWKSTSGMQNFGMVRFDPVPAVATPPTETRMELTMSFVAPRPVAAVFRRSSGLANFVREQMVHDALYRFQQDLSRRESRSPPEESTRT